MNPDEDADTKKLGEVEKEAARQEDRDPVPSTSGGDAASIEAGDRAGSSEKRKRPAATPVKRKKPTQVEVIELSDDSSSGEDGPRAKEEEEDAAASGEGEPPRKRKKQGGARKDKTTTKKKAKRAKSTEATSGEAVEDAEGIVKHTDGYGNEELTDFFKVEEKPST